MLALQKRVREALQPAPGNTAEEIARSAGADAEDVFHVLRHLAANDPSVTSTAAPTAGAQKFYRGG